MELEIMAFVVSVPVPVPIPIPFPMPSFQYRGLQMAYFIEPAWLSASGNRCTKVSN